MYMRGATESHRTSHLRCHSQVADMASIVAASSTETIDGENDGAVVREIFSCAAEYRLVCGMCANTRESCAHRNVSSLWWIGDAGA